MALKDQPYLPLYVDDFLSDEKLSLCSAESTGVYIRLMCLMHKSDEYGVILLKQKFKQSVKQVSNFACMLAKQMPYASSEIESALTELIDMEVIRVDCENGDRLYQKRMVKDGKISTVRALAGSKGGEATQSNNKELKEMQPEKSSFAADFALAKSEANTVIGIGTVIDIVTSNKSESKKAPTEPKPYKEIIDYLNGKAETSFRYTSPKTQTMIDARLNEKYTVEDFKTVIDKKTEEWLHDTNCKYLRPETLFGTRFDQYLNQLKCDNPKSTYNKPVPNFMKPIPDYSEGESTAERWAREDKEKAERAKGIAK